MLRRVGVGGAGRRFASEALHAEVQGAAHASQLNNTIGYYLSAQARRLGHKNAFRVPHQGVNWTYIDVKKNSDALAQGLVERSIKPGDRVLSVQPSTAESYMVHAACAKMGAICVNFNVYEATPDALANAIDKYQPRAVIIREFCDFPGKKGASKRKSVYDMLHQSIPELDQVIGNLAVRSPKFPSVKLVCVADENMNLPGTATMRECVVWGPFNYYECRLRRIATFMDANHPSLILASPTGRDVVYTHKNIMTAAFHAAQHLGMKNDDRVMLAPQSGSSPAFFLGHYACIASGATLSYGGEHLHADAHIGPFLENLELEKVQGLFIRKEQLDLLLPVVKGQGVGEYLKWIAIVSDEKIPEAYAAEVKEAFKVEEVSILSGPLETASILSMEKVNGAAPVLKMTPNVAGRVVGDEGGPQAKTLGRGIQGRLRLKGPSIATQYWNNGGMMEADKDVLGFYDFKQDAVVSKDGVITNIVSTA